MRDPVPATPEQAINMLAYINYRLSRLLALTMLVVVHLVIWLAILTLAWWFQWSAQTVEKACQTVLQQRPIELLLAVGVSGTTVLAFYRWILRKTMKASSGLMANYVTSGP